MFQSSILQFCYLLETQMAFNLDKVMEDRVCDRILKGLNDQPLPWIETEEQTAEQLSLDVPEHGTSTSNIHQYQVYIGPFKTSDVLDFWQKRLSDPPEIFPELVAESDHLSCYGTFRVDENGALLKDSLKLSGVPLLLGIAQSKLPREIAEKWNFSSELSSYKECVQGFFESQIKRMDQAGEQVTGKTLRDIANHIVRDYNNWQPDDFRELGYWVRFGPREEEKTPMNSFFLHDIERVGESIAKGSKLGSALQTYLSDQVPKRINMDERQVQQSVLSLSSLPLGRWPANPDHQLSLQQQCAVNLAIHNDGAGLLSVNGPPGTGKTTMLRDIVANIVVQRAVRMAAFDDPNDAFKEPKTIGGEVSPTSPYLVDSSITGYEIVATSSNNGAVENISRELPALDAVAEAYRADIGYFSETACSVLQDDAWGLFSATLGNKGNRLNFTKLFWQKMRGSDQVIDFIADLEPPFELNWQNTRQTFFQLKHEVETEISQRQTYEKAVSLHSKAWRRVQATRQEMTDKQQQAVWCQRDLNHAEGRFSLVQEQIQLKDDSLQNILKRKPSFGRRLLSVFIKQLTVETYRTQVEQATAALEAAREQLNVEKLEVIRRRQALIDAETQQQQAQQIAEIARRQLKAIEVKMDEGRLRLKESFADETWWTRSEAAVQIDVPWIDKELDDLRSRLFIAAMQVHQSFIEQAADKFRKNIKLWVTLLEKGWPESSNKNHAITLWQSAFLVIPVVSTTFASVQSMFKLLKEESLGWLLIDEAGQAVPQAAIGAMWRTKRVIAVGDPLQLEPVFTLQSPVVEGLRQHFQLAQCWNPYSYSVQGLADRVNPYGAEIMQQGEPLWVGCPLRVHRRCIEPMFSISNQIAYGGKMILATISNELEHYPAGESRWIHVSGACQGKHWVAEQGEEVIELLAQVFAHTSEMPEVFVITPFKEVSNKLKKVLRKEYLRWMSPRVGSDQIGGWLTHSVGTVHTFQGKEADIVIFVLGLDQFKSGAAHWASQKPNLLNVAATRARHRLYVVGDKGLWREYSYFKTAVELL